MAANEHEQFFDDLPAPARAGRRRLTAFALIVAGLVALIVLLALTY